MLGALSPQMAVPATAYSPLDMLKTAFPPVPQCTGGLFGAYPDSSHDASRWGLDASVRALQGGSGDLGRVGGWVCGENVPNTVLNST